MKYYRRLNIYKASNVTFNPETFEAHSYGWWKFVSKVNGIVIFNDLRYSISTRKHQLKVRRLLNELGVKVDLVVNTRMSLGAVGYELDILKNALWNLEDKNTIKMIKKIFKVNMTQAEIQALYNTKEELLCNAYLERAFEYSEKRRLNEELRRQDHDKKFSSTVQTVINEEVRT